MQGGLEGKKGTNRHLGRGDGKKEKRKEVKHLVLEVQGGLTVLQGPGISAVTVPNISWLYRPHLLSNL